TRQLRKKGEHFSSVHNGGEEELQNGNGTKQATVTLAEPTNRVIPFLPLLTVFVVNFACTLYIFPRWIGVTSRRSSTAGSPWPTGRRCGRSWWVSPLPSCSSS